MQRAVKYVGLAALVMILPSAASAAGAGSRAIIVDHNCVDVAAIPEHHVSAAAALRVLVRHASVGQGIAWGLDCLAGEHPTNSACSCFPAGKYDRSRWVFEPRQGNWRDKVDDLVAQTAARLDDFNVFTMKLCYIDALGDNQPDWEYFRSRMDKLEADYPAKTFVWWTIPLTRDGQSGTDLFNAQMRSYCAAQGKVLFDIADIECHDPNGSKLLNDRGNEIISASYTKEIHAGHLNPTGRVRVAAAFWHLMARVAGWIPCTCPDANAPTDFDPNAPPFLLTLGPKASWSPAHEGYDPNLPGYHLTGDIASVTLRAQTPTPPSELILAITTSPGMPPMLENFTLAAPCVKLTGEPFNPNAGIVYYERIACSTEWQPVPAVDPAAYLKFDHRDSEVRVTLHPKALALLQAECTISWIDWYR